MKTHDDYTFVTLRMPTSLVDEIEELAAQETRSRSAQIIVLLRTALKLPLALPASDHDLA